MLSIIIPILTVFCDIFEKLHFLIFWYNLKVIINKLTIILGHEKGTGVYLFHPVSYLQCNAKSYEFRTRLLLVLPLLVLL